MSKCKRDLISEFELEGRFLGFIVKDGYKLKYLRLSTANGEYTIKLAKELRRSLQQAMIPGEWVKVSGWQKQDQKAGVSKLKAERMIRTIPGSAPSPVLATSSDPSPPIAPAAKAQGCILVCQKSDCCKLGGRAVAQALQAEVDDRALADQVTIRGTGCMKRCKAGPNIVMPDKTRYTQIRPQDVPTLFDRHFPQSSTPLPPSARQEAEQLINLRTQN